jgi:homoserine dehydrogenase
LKEVKLCLAGFGAVAKRFCRLLQEKEKSLEFDFGIKVKIAGVCSPSRGAMIDVNGLDIEQLFRMEEKSRRFDSGHQAYRNIDALGMINASSADIFIELSTLSITDGEPAASYIFAALNKGLHVITANKGPLACQYQRLHEKAVVVKKMFLYETIVMDGTPVFNLVEETLPGNNIFGIQGILNGTSNFVLQQLELGSSYDEAICEAQRIQLAEADPSMDVDGWDGAAKICALANILMSANMTPGDVDRTSIRQIGIDDIKEAKQAGCKIKYICEAGRDENNAIKLSVKPRKLPQNHTFCNVNGSSAAITLYTDLAGEISIIQTNPGILQTAYGVYSDLLKIIKTVYTAA